MEDINRAIAALASLILAHHKRIKAYSSLHEATSHQDVRFLCERNVDHSKQCIANLSRWRSAYGGFAKSLDYSAGKDTWHQVRLFFSSNPERTIVDRCEEMEQEILKMYESAMLLIPSYTVGDLQLQVKSLERMVRRLHEVRERKAEGRPKGNTWLGSLATK
jgi:hypothetical protein